MRKQYEVVAREIIRTGYLVMADSEEEARHMIEHPESSHTETFSEYYDLVEIESVEEQ